MKKIIHIVGNRPQFIKLAVLHKKLSVSGVFSQEIVHTGQHFSYEMNEVFFRELAIPIPSVNLNLQHTSANQFIGIAADALQQYFSGKKGEIIFVYGDTNTTLAAALAAKRANLTLVHFEAGVRTTDDSMPEEINRLITDRLANVNYCCTQLNFNNLQAEGYGSSIASLPVHTGDLMLDAFLQIIPGKTQHTLPREYTLCTIHRAANLQSKNNLSQIIDGLNELHQQMAIVMPVHPHTQKKMLEYGLQTDFITLPPVGYPEMKQLLSGATYIITDSGGTSREAYFAGKRSLILMEKPFWPEIIKAGCAIQTNAGTVSLVHNFHLLNNLQPDFKQRIFGSGTAAENICRHLASYFSA